MLWVARPEVSGMVVGIGDVVGGRSEHTALLGAAAVVPGTFAPSLNPAPGSTKG